MQNIFGLSFNNKLFSIFLLLSIIPLILIAVFISQSVQNNYKETLQKAFETNVKNREKIISYYLESNKEWIKSIAKQNIFSNEIESYEATGNFRGNDTYAAMSTLQSENKYIEKMYITDKKGRILSSTSSNDEGKNVSEFGITLSNIRAPYYFKLRNTENNKRMITLATPFISRESNTIIGYLFEETDSKIIQDLINGTYNNTQAQNTDDTFLDEPSIIDNDGYDLTKIDSEKQTKVTQNFPIEKCVMEEKPMTTTWKNWENKEIFGSFKCTRFDDIQLTIIVSRDVQSAFQLSNNIRNMIIVITILISIIYIITIKIISKSITDPIHKLIQGIKELSNGNTQYTFDIKTHDEFEKLGNAFNEMTQKINLSIAQLKQQDQQLNTVNAELEKEKQIIQAERDKLDVIITGITDGIIALDTERKIISCNKAAIELLGSAKDELIGQSIAKIITVVDNAEPIDVTQYAPIENKEFDGIIFSNDHIKLSSYSGKTTMVKMVTGKIKDSASVNLGCILTFHDLSKEAQLEDMKLDFVSMAAHELRTPITSIRGYSQLLKDELTDCAIEQAADWKTLVTRISISAEQLLALVENLLNITKIEKGILTMACKPEVWKELIEEVAAVFKERAQNKNITLTIRDIDPSLVAYVDKIRINEVISNLISNAINYTHEGGFVTVEVHTSPDGKWIETSVADNGKGIPKTAQTHLFEKFFRVTGPLEQGSKGNGLGLYISKSIVEMHGGKIWVESDEGKGAKFSYTVQRIENKDVSKYSY